MPLRLPMTGGPMEPLLLVLIAAMPSLVAAIGSFIIAGRLGYGPLRTEVREERGALVATLKDRLAIVERENEELEHANTALTRRVTMLEADKRVLEQRIDALERRIIQMTVGVD